jgi:serine/threonine-protein kinase
MSEQARASGAFDQTVLSAPASVSHFSRPRPVEAEDLLIGVELAGTYRIERVLGEGGMGRLYEARHLRLDRSFAVKVIHHPLAERDDMRARFDREAKVMSRVQSDHVVDVVDVVSAPDGRTCIVTELLSGSDLEQHLKASGGRLSAREAVGLVRQCLRGLSAAHSLNIVHRDLKPANLFLARDAAGGVVLKVLDFGVAKLGGDAEMTNTGVIVGTPAFMAPEQARASTQADVRSDIYAVGAVLYRMLTGQSPYGGADSNATLIKLMEESPERPSLIERSIAPALEAVIEKAMARDPAQRFQSAAELDRALLPFDDGARSSISLAGTAGADAAPDDLKTLGRRARLARPFAISMGLLLALFAGLFVSGALALLVDGLSPETRLGRTELVLVLLGGLVAALAVGMATVRAVAQAWRNGAMVQALSARFVRTLAVACGVYGGLELSSVIGATWLGFLPAETTPYWAAARCAAALVAGVLAFVTLARPRR